MILQVSQEGHMHALIVVKTHGLISADGAQTNTMAVRLGIVDEVTLSKSLTRFTELFHRPLASNNHLHMTCRLAVGFCPSVANQTAEQGKGRTMATK